MPGVVVFCSPVYEQALRHGSGTFEPMRKTLNKHGNVDRCNKYYGKDKTNAEGQLRLNGKVIALAQLVQEAWSLGRQRPVSLEA